MTAQTSAVGSASRMATRCKTHIEAALSAISWPLTVQIHGSGRTDAGVHANGQCFHFDADWKHPPEKLIRALHAQLPTTIQIKSIQPVSDEFHARFSVIGKRYTFRYYLGRAEPRDDRYVWACRDIPLDLEAMNASRAALDRRARLYCLSVPATAKTTTQTQSKRLPASTSLNTANTSPSPPKALASYIKWSAVSPAHSTPSAADA